MPKSQKSEKRSILAPILALLLVLALAGTLLFSAFRDKIEHWEYPQRFTEYVEYYAGKYGIDPMILYAFIRTESNFDPNADSDAGARGLMQITEVTFDWIKMKIAPKESLTVRRPLRPRDEHPVRQLLCQLLPGPLQRPSGHRRRGLPQRRGHRGRSARAGGVLNGRRYAGPLPLPADAALRKKKSPRAISTTRRFINNF